MITATVKLDTLSARSIYHSARRSVPGLQYGENRSYLIAQAPSCIVSNVSSVCY